MEISTQGIDICAITETWLKPPDEETIPLQQITPPGYNIISYPRSNGKIGGGLAVIYKKHIKLQNHSTMKNLKTMECGQFQMKYRSDIISLFVIYHIPNTRVSQFCEELLSILENSIAPIRNKLLFMGDFNIHMDQPEDANTIIFNDLLESLNLRNNITFQTHISGHTLDLIINDQTEPLVKCVKRGHTFADHCLVQATIGIEKHIPLDKSVTYRKFKNINELKFSRDLNNHLTKCGTHEELEAKIDCYNRVILATLDKHAPQKTKLVKVSNKQPWFTDRIKDKIRVRQKKELSWIKDPNDYNYQAFYNQRRYCSNLIKSAQRQFFKGKITENRGNYKEIFRITNKLLGREDELPLPLAEDLITQANQFNNFFVGKIEKIIKDLAPSSMTATLNDEYLELTYETTNRLTNFKTINDQDILSIINRAPPKSCKLNPMPTTLLKVDRNVIVPNIKDIVNTSVVSGRFTRNIKQALLRPLLKKKGLDLTLNNYRPVSNLAYI